MAAQITINMLYSQPNLLLDVPAQDLSYKMCQIAVYKDPSLLQHIPFTLLEKNECHVAKLAVGVDGMSIKLLDPKYLSQDICNIASENLKKTCDVENGFFLEHIPYHLMTKEICLKAVQHNKRNIDYVPLAFLSDEIGIEIMRTNDNALLAKLPLLMRKKLSQQGL